MSEKLSIFGKDFWDLWVMKLLRNVASIKYQFLMAFFILVAYGMFSLGPDGKPWISANSGLAFLGGAFLTLATARIISRTKLTENETLDTDK
jgi:enoyl-CoA hydratase/carnithine racemase